MNSPFTPPAVTAEGAYTFTEDDFPNGCLIVTDALSGRRTAIGENKLGLTVKVALDVPLCGGCDSPLDAGVCADCRLVFLDVKDAGEGWHQVAA